MTLTVEIYDKVSPVNGVPAEIVIERHFLQEQDAYLIKQGKRTVVMQTEANTPYQDMPFEEAAQKHLEELQASIDAANITEDTEEQ